MANDDDDTPPYPRRPTPPPETVGDVYTLEGILHDGVVANKRLASLDSRLSSLESFRKADRQHIQKLSVDLEMAYQRIVDLEDELKQLKKLKTD